jgi:hypothetical protein
MLRFAQPPPRHYAGRTVTSHNQLLESRFPVVCMRPKILSCCPQCPDLLSFFFRVHYQCPDHSFRIPDHSFPIQAPTDPTEFFPPQPVRLLYLLLNKASVVWGIPNLHNRPNSLPKYVYSKTIRFIPNLLGVLCAF